MSDRSQDPQRTEIRVLELGKVGRGFKVHFVLEDGDPSGSDAGQETENILGVVHLGEVKLVRDL